MSSDIGACLRQVERLQAEQNSGNDPTEESWRSGVYSCSEDIFLDDEELHVEWYFQSVLKFKI